MQVEILVQEGDQMVVRIPWDKCLPLTGKDGFDQPVQWKHSETLAHLLGRTIRLRVFLQSGASLYAFRFAREAPSTAALGQHEKPESAMMTSLQEGLGREPHSKTSLTDDGGAVTAGGAAKPPAQW